MSRIQFPSQGSRSVHANRESLTPFRNPKNPRIRFPIPASRIRFPIPASRIRLHGVPYPAPIRDERRILLAGIASRRREAEALLRAPPSAYAITPS